MWTVILLMSCIAQSTIGWEISKLTTPDIDMPHSAYWDDDTESLYFVSFVTSGEQASLCRYSFDGIFYSAYIIGASSPSFIVPINKKLCEKCSKCDEKLFAVGIGHDVVIVKWNGKSTKAKIVRSIFSVENDNPLIRYDVAVADSSGRLYTGSLSQTLCNAPALRSVYRYTKTASVDRLFGGLKSTVGIAFNEKQGKMYHFDACQQLLTEYDYDPHTGDICNGRVIFEYPLNGVPINTNLPFGLVIDTNGILYFCVYTGAVWKFNPWTFTVIEVINLPVAGALGLAIGGTHKDTLYVISGAIIIDALTFNTVREIRNGSSIYAITGLDLEGPPSTRMNVK